MEDSCTLRFNAPAGAMDNTVRSLVKKYRDSVINLIRPYSSRWSLIAPASLNQESLVFVQKLASPASAYHVALSFRLCTSLNKKVFLSACKILLIKHSQLRASFRTIIGNEQNETLSCQIISDPGEIPVLFDDRENSDSQSQTVLANDYNREFDIENGPLVRWLVVNASSDSPVVLMTMHHAVTDAWSIRILFRELLSIYNSLQTGVSPTATVDPIYSYIDFTLNQHNLLTGDKFCKQIDAYGRIVKPCLTPLSFTTDFKRSTFTDLKGSTLPFTISADMYSKIVSVARQNAISVNAMLFSSFALFLYEETGQTYFVSGMPFANRSNPSFTNTAGYIVNTVAIPVTIASDSTCSELMQTVNTTISRSADFQEIPFPALVAHINPSRDMEYSPVFQVLFNYISRSLIGNAGDFIYDGNPDDTRTVEGFDIKPFPVKQQEGQYDLTLEIIERNGYASGQFKYSTALFTSDSAHRMLQHYLLTLNRLIDNPSGNVSEKKVVERPRKKQLAIAATFTADLLAESFDFWINRLDLEYEPVFTPYGQVLQQLIDQSSVFNTNSDGCNVILLRLDDMNYNRTGDKTLEKILTDRCDEILAALSTTASSSKAIFLIFFCPSAPDLTSDAATKASIDGIQARYAKQFNDLPGVYATGSDTILSWYPVMHYHDRLRLENGHIPYTDEFHIVIATAIIRRLFILKQKPVKVISVDCDNTLWSGIAAEDGPGQIIVSDNHRKFHEFLSSQKDTGRLLTLVSKNRKDDVDAVFSENESMQLSPLLIYSKRINWEPKSQNISSLADEINVGLDSFLFIDDNPSECAEVSSVHPEVITIQFPAEVSKIPPFINSLWMLDSPKSTAEDYNRLKYYQIEKLRNLMRSQTQSFAEFLDQLELTVTFEDFNEQNGERLSQLTYRTNQFNFSGTRLSYTELCRLQHKGYDIHAVSVKDRFGDYGIAGMTMCRTEDDTASVEQFLLSCRVLGRGVEHQILNTLVQYALGKNARTLRLQYKITGRNRPAMDFIEKILVQCPSARNENCLILEQLADVPRFSPVMAEDKSNASHISPTASVADSSIQDRGYEDLLLRNRHYYDIVENLSSLSEIRAAIEHYDTKKSSPLETFPDCTSETSPLESSIAEIWKNTLRTGTISLSTNFFDHGGTSLQLPQILSELEKQLGVNLPLVDLFKYTTVKKLAAYIQSKMNAASDTKINSPLTTNRRLIGAQMMRQRQQQSRSRLNA